MKHSYLTRKHPDLSEIKSPDRSNKYPEKFEYLMAKHHCSKAMRDHELEIWGIPQFLDGLGYHYNKFRALEKKQSPGNKTKTQFSNTLNEITAYFNRLGQIYACITSKWFQEYVTKDKLPLLCPSILALIPYRNKYAAHRSLDRTRKESPSQHESFANICLRTEWHGKADLPDMHIGYQIKIAAQDRCQILKDFYPQPVQDIEHFTDKDEIFLDFVPVKHHDQVILEAFKTMEQLFVCP